MSQRVRHTLSAAVFIILQQGGEICLLRRISTGWMDGCFSLPAGGLESGETIRAAAVREAREEVGVRIDPAALRYVHTLHSVTEGRDWVGHFFAATNWHGTPVVCEPEKHADLIWRPISDLPTNTIPYVRQALLSLDRGLGYSEYGWHD